MIFNSKSQLNYLTIGFLFIKGRSGCPEWKMFLTCISTLVWILPSWNDDTAATASGICGIEHFRAIQSRLRVFLALGYLLFWSFPFPVTDCLDLFSWIFSGIGRSFAKAAAMATLEARPRAWRWTAHYPIKSASKATEPEENSSMILWFAQKSFGVSNFVSFVLALGNYAAIARVCIFSFRFAIMP